MVCAGGCLRASQTLVVTRSSPSTLLRFGRCLRMSVTLSGRVLAPAPERAILEVLALHVSTLNCRAVFVGPWGLGPKVACWASAFAHLSPLSHGFHGLPVDAGRRTGVPRTSRPWCPLQEGEMNVTSSSCVRHQSTFAPGTDICSPHGRTLWCSFCGRTT